MDGQLGRREKAGHADATIPRRTRGPDRHCATPDMTLLAKAVEEEVIPRLLDARTAGRQIEARMPSLSEVEALCGHVVDRDTDAALRLIEDVMRDGVGVEAIYANLLGASARMLGEMWERDQLSFIDVTVGLCSLHQILFRLSPDFDPEEPGGESVRRALFAPTPGESHVFGALVVARFFSRAGWQTWTEISIGHDMLCDLVRRQRFDLVGLSISADRNIDNLARAIDGMRAAAGRRPLKVLIGGHSVDIDPSLVERVGADAAAGDPASAVETASRLVDRTCLYA